ncbi:hypothetical protein IC620_15455 [Hazenella sp. IB182357]|uniref:Uncharacterized protein n=1 Tax=Polycladospora coralii TaxID=2771432 RepID=A0A926RVE7_9BACL|nr:hypothetical protein [Polycladospora coralii]MBD1373742.1 hypothetical protein [Polycladospora coralii]
MNQWHVYEYVKAQYMATGQLPHIDEAIEAFPDTDYMLIQEGMAEFRSTIQWGA